MNFIDHLAVNAILSPEDVGRLELTCEQTGLSCVEAVSQLGLMDDDAIAKHQSDFCNFPLADNALFPDTLPTIENLDMAWLRRKHVVPIAIADDYISAAFADATDNSLMQALHFATRKQIDVYIAPLSSIDEHLGRLVPEELVLDNAYFGQSDAERFADIGSDAPVVRLVDHILSIASRRGASDVHIEPDARHVNIRLRIDGNLQELEKHPIGMAEGIASRIKVMASLDIAESRLPQDGRLRLTAAGRDIDVRVSTSPVTYGESIVLRLLGQARVPLDIDSLGIPQTGLSDLRKALARPHGIVLVTGPTGSGKTTTLYSALTHLRRPDVKILSVEDPVEIVLEGINQVQVQPEINLDYARTLRAFLRQDPDILMVGEIRDQETAEISLRAALTGHLVLSTLHTNSALGAFTRLHDIGIEPFLAASTVIACVAQRLVRTLCADCRTTEVLNSSQKKMFEEFSVDAPTSINCAKGCKKCSGTGYAGRAPLFEIIMVDQTLRDLVRTGHAESYVTDKRETLFGHGLSLVSAGRTSFDEIMRVVQLDD